MRARDYQDEAERKTAEAMEDARSVLGSMPTGCGKTVVFSFVIKRRLPLGKALVVAHREELIWQARDKVQKVTGLPVEVEMGEYRASQQQGLFTPRAEIICSSVQTLTAGGDGGGRIGKFNPDDFATLIIDEAHHAVSPSYRRVIDYFLTNPNLKVFGVTATPDRADEEALGQVFAQVAFDYGIEDMVERGWLVPVEQEYVSIEDLDFSSVRTQAGDLNLSDLDAVMTQEKNLHGVAGATIDLLGSRRGIGFAASVEQARLLSEICNRHRLGMSAHVHGGTDKDERRLIIQKFAKGEIQFLWNCGVFTEGFDDSGVEVIAMARPTKSRALYAQMAGRGTRPLESIVNRLNATPIPALRRAIIKRSPKPFCHIIDFVGNSGKHHLVSSADVLGGNYSEEVVELAKKHAHESGHRVRMQEQLKLAEEELEERERRRLEEEARKARLVAKVSWKSQKVDPFSVLSLKPVAPRGWDTDKVLSERQKKVLRDVGINPDSIPYASGKKLIDEIFRRREQKLCTYRQARTLKKYNLPTEVGFDEARRAIDAIVANGWRRPAGLELQTVGTVPALESGTASSRPAEQLSKPPPRRIKPASPAPAFALDSDPEPDPF